ncbi:MAG: hypothetical protein A2Z31_01820 [candidate division NC10 bacterium RBG_16_65_8]|nr:MAG: hypothetical protein A2Z31_01820 [candidate division NC10 bacterium RBG_16_65_8]
MNRVVRTRVVNLLLGAFRDRGKRHAILWLSLYCELSGERRHTAVAAADLEAAWAHRYPDDTTPGRALEKSTAALEGLLTCRGPDWGPRAHDTAPRPQDGAPLAVERHPDLVPFLAAACDRIRIYAKLVRQMASQERALERWAPVRRAVAEAAMCFNAGLFFEAHELLEHHWVGLPRSPARRYLQGIIQISVGFHHAMRGSYHGAVNQLEKGLAKLAEASGDALGLDRDRFRRDVEAARQEMVARGQQGMRPAALEELPRMHLGR